MYVFYLLKAEFKAWHAFFFYLFYLFSGSTNYTSHKIVNETTFTLFITISKLSLCGMNEVPFLHLL